MNANGLFAVITKNWINPEYVGARLGAARVLSAHKFSSVQFAPENDHDISEQCNLAKKAIDLSPNAIVFAPAHATQMKIFWKRCMPRAVPCCVSSANRSLRPL